MLMKMKYFVVLLEGKTLKKAIGILVVMALVVIMIVTFVKNQTEKNNAIDEEKLGQKVGIKTGQTAPDFTLETLDGDQVTLSKLKGKKVVLNFWATWCPPCKKEMPHLQSYYEKRADQDNVEIVAVDLTYNNQTVEQVKEFAESYKVTFPILLMEKPDIGETYEILTIPTTFFIDTKGRIQYQIKGPVDEELLEKYISKLN